MVMGRAELVTDAEEKAAALGGWTEPKQPSQLPQVRVLC